jgi:hypothetical protein
VLPAVNDKVDKDNHEVLMIDPNSAPAVPNARHERRKPYRDEAAGRIPTTRAATIRGRWLTIGGLILLVGLIGQTHAALSHLPGTLANPGFEGQPMKSVYFFAGQWRFPGPAFYDGAIPGVRVTPASNDCLYTIFPSDGNNQLGWSERPDKREHAVDLMLAAGVNVVTMSYWGPPNTDRWAFWAPMQTATGAHDQLFETAVGRPVLITPSIESSLATIGAPRTGCHDDLGPIGQSPGFDFLDAFPGTPDDPAPALVEQIVDLVSRYILSTAHPEWREKWTQLYDRDGDPRYAIALLHVGSNQPEVTDETFARGFTSVADRVYRETGVRVGFMLDALPPEHGARFKPTPTHTGPWLAAQSAVLAIQPFNPDVFSGRCRVGDDCDAVLGSPPLLELVEWKRRFVSSWVSTGIPVMLDVSPGFDARDVFEGSPRYGNNVPWRNGQTDLLSLGVRGLTANTWNGYTEGYAVVPSCSDVGPPGLPLCPDRTGADAAYVWFKELTPPGGTPADRLPATLIGSNPSSAVYSDPIALTFRLTSFNLAQALFGTADRVPVSSRAVRIRVGDQEVQGTTTDNGGVSVTITIGQPPGEVPVMASFDGDAEFLAISARSSLLVEKERTRVQWLSEPDSAGQDGPGVRVSARLTDDDGQPVAARTVVFTMDPGPDARMCSGETDPNGVAGCNVAVARRVGLRTVSLQFAGDAYYESAAAQLEVDLNPRRQ